MCPHLRLKQNMKSLILSVYLHAHCKHWDQYNYLKLYIHIPLLLKCQSQLKLFLAYLHNRGQMLKKQFRIIFFHCLQKSEYLIQKLWKCCVSYVNEICFQWEILTDILLNDHMKWQLAQEDPIINVFSLIDHMLHFFFIAEE